MAEKAKRVSVSLEDFLRVVIAEREQYPTVIEAAKALGMAEMSFRQRFTRERKDFPEVFKGVPTYGNGGGRKRATKAEAMEILARLRAAKSETATELVGDIPTNV